MTAVLLTLSVANAENKLTVVKTSSNEVAVELTNSDAVTGMQFSINVRGGIKLVGFENGERMSNAGWQGYSYLKNDSTLNVVLLAPYRSSISGGKGVIAKVSYTPDASKSSSANRVFLSNVVLGDPQAQSLSFSQIDLEWSVENNNATSAFATLAQNYPNPFNPSTTLAYRLDRSANVKLVVYDIAGREVKTLVNKYQFQGQYNIRWESTDEAGLRVPSGTYIVRLQADDEIAAKKMILTK